MKPFPTLYVASANAHKLEEIHTILEFNDIYTFLVGIMLQNYLF